jgi:hypothetical protein
MLPHRRADTDVGEQAKHEAGADADLERLAHAPEGQHQGHEVGHRRQMAGGM